jgi:hypothetical protein
MQEDKKLADALEPIARSAHGERINKPNASKNCGICAMCLEKVARHGANRSPQARC